MSTKCTTELEHDVSELKEMVKSQNKRIDELIKYIKEGCDAQNPKELKSTLSNVNPYLECLNPDILYHLNIDTQSTDIPKVFGDVRFVCMGGTAARMEQFATCIMKEIGLTINTAVQLKNISAEGNRYALFKVGPVLCASHGIGGPSISILLHELVKLMHYAKCQQPVFFRLGTCGGVGIEPGTVVITTEALDAQLRAVHEVVVHTVPQLRPTKLDQELARKLKSLAEPSVDGYDTIMGKTMCATDFYEGQSRMDGAFCDYTPEKRAAFLEQLAKSDVVNMEMECTAFAAITNQAGIRAAIVCVAIINRLEGDQINTPPEELNSWDLRPQTLIARYMRKKLYDDDEDTERSACDCANAGE